MSYFHKLAGSASSTYTTMMFSGGAALGALDRRLLQPARCLPIAIVMMAREPGRQPAGTFDSVEQSAGLEAAEETGAA